MNKLIEAGAGMSRAAQKFERPINNKNAILILGDSLAYGVGVNTPENSFAGVIAQNFANKSIKNNAEIGETIGSLQNTVDEKLTARYEQVYIVVGGNDIMRMHINIFNSKKSLEALVKRVSDQADQVFLVTTGDFHNVSLSPWILKSVFAIRANMIRNTAIGLETSINNFDYVDFHSIRFDKHEYMQLEAADGYHLNDQGIQELVKTVLSGQY